MDYIQKDLDLIRMATGEVKPDQKERKKYKKKNAADVDGDKIKKKSKTLSPEKLKKDLEKMNRKEKRGRKSTGVGRPSALGRIKLSSMKKHRTKSEEFAGNITSSAEPDSSVKTASPAVSGRSRKSLDPNAVPIEGIRFEEGAKIEAVDHGQWYKAKIVKVDQEKMDILIHFDGWGSRFDTWFPMTSNLIRGRTQVDVKPDAPKYESGEDVLAKWIDGNFYPATVISVKDSGSCQVMYFDGMKKLLRPNLIKKMSEKEKETAMHAAEKLMLMQPSVTDSPQSSVSAAESPPSDGVGFRRYRTSANDRERRIAARSGLATPTHTPESGSGPRKASKRRTSQASSSAMNAAPAGSRNSSDDETFNAKKARLDKITSSLISKASTPPESVELKLQAITDANKAGAGDEDGNKPEDRENPNQIGESRKSVAVPRGRPAGARGPKTGARRGRPRKYPMTSSATRNDKKREGQRPLDLQESGSKGLVREKSGDVGKVDKTSLEGTAMAKPQSASGEIKTEAECPKLPENREVPAAESDNEPKTLPSYKPGDTVLAKWADCRSYLAYIIRKEPDDNYRIRYYDGMVKVVKSSLIHPWVGPLPDALKSFKPGIRKQRSRSATDLKRGRGRPRLEDARTIAERRRTLSLSKPETLTTARRRRRTESNEAPVDTIQYTAGEKVLAKWTDLKWYPAIVVSKADDDQYEVRYHDEMSRIVRDTWLNPWKPPPMTKKENNKPDESKISDDKEGQQNFETAPAEESADIPSQQSEELVKENSEDGTLQDAKDASYEEIVPKNLKKFQLNSSVLAKWMDGRSYPATIRELLEGGKYVVEYENGNKRTLKYTSLKLWNPSALPPLVKDLKHKKMASETQDALSIMKKSGSLQFKVRDSSFAKDKMGRLSSARQAQMPRQVVRGYDAYYARLPAQDVLDTDHHKFKCRVTGCRKSFRKEQMLRQHHKYYHQQRYKLRDQESQPAPVKRKSSKDDGNIRRRVSADYEALSKGLDTANVNINDIEQKHVPRSRGAKPPMDIYQKQQGNVSLSSTSSMRDSSSGIEEARRKSDSTPRESQLTRSLPDVVMDGESMSMKKRGKWALSEAGENKDGTALIVAEKCSPETPDEEKLEATNEDVIRCMCNLEEEEGFMIQCEGCFTWQHAICVGVDQPDEKKGVADEAAKSEERSNGLGKIVQRSTIDEGYVCWVCKNPKNVRKSKQFLYNNEFLTKGKLPSLSDLVELPAKTKKSPSRSVDTLMLSSLMEEVTTMQETLNGIKQKIKIATLPGEHPMLNTWRDKTKKNKQDLAEDKGEDQGPSEMGTDDHAKDIEKTKTDNKAQEMEEGNKKAYNGGLKESMASNGKKGHSSPTNTSEEDREAYIHNCRENLLDHIAELEAELDNRITRLNDFVSRFDTRVDEDVEDPQDSNLLQKDLTAVQKLLSNC